MATEEHSTPHEGQEEYQEDRATDASDRLAKAEELEAVAREKHKAHRRIAYWQLAAYLLIFSLSVIGWWQIEQESDARCASGEINRQALRNIITGVGDLGAKLVTNGEDPSTPEQEAALAQFTAFEEEQLALIEGPVCPEED